MTARSFISTEELLHRLAQAPQRRGTKVLRRAGMAVGLLSLPLLLGLLFLGERVQPMSSHVRRTEMAADFIFERPGEGSEVAIAINLPRPGGIFMDGVHLAMSCAFTVQAARGRHVLLIHLGEKSFRRVLDVGDCPLSVTLDTREERLNVKEINSPAANRRARSKP